MGNFIAILGTLDTKSQYINLLKDEIIKRGHTSKKEGKIAG